LQFYRQKGDQKEKTKSDQRVESDFTG